MLSAAFDQEIDGSTGFRPTINVIAEEDMNGSLCTDRRQISIDYGEHLLKQLGAAVDVAHRIDTNSLRQTRLSYLGFRSQQSQHLLDYMYLLAFRCTVFQKLPTTDIVNDLA